MPEQPAFARDPGTAAYYEQRAAEYDEWYLGQGRFLPRERPGWDAELAGGAAMVGDALALPFADGSFDRLFTGHFYGHLPPAERAAFLAEARRVARELVVVDSARRPGVPAEEEQERVLNDGSRHRVFKRYLTADELAEEIDGEVLRAGTWFAVACSISW